MASFSEGKYPKTIEEYEILNQDEDKLEFLNRGVESKYYESGEDIAELMVLYVKEHFDKFAP